LIDIRVLDHIIIGESGALSFAARGALMTSFYSGFGGALPQYPSKENMKCPESPLQSVPVHDYGLALKSAVTWMGDRYLLAAPLPRRSNEHKDSFSESQRSDGSRKPEAHRRAHPPMRLRVSSPKGPMGGKRPIEQRAPETIERLILAPSALSALQESDVSLRPPAIASLNLPAHHPRVLQSP
jgi:hypothetical protein